MTETKTENLTAALSALQGKLTVVNKSSSAKVKTKTGGDYSYTYANLADMATVVYPLLGEVGLAFVCVPTFRGDKYLLIGRLQHTSGEVIVGQFDLPRNAPVQTLGSAITYGRRYLLGCLTGVVTGDEDDDGKAANDAASAVQARAGQAQRRASRPAQPAARRAPEPPAPEAATSVPQQPSEQANTTLLKQQVVAAGQFLGMNVDGLKEQYQAKHDGSLQEANAEELSAFLGELRQLTEEPA